MEQKLVVYNSLKGEKESFKPINKDHVGMYVCGPTVYSNVHLGNCRTFISFDLIFRYLQYLGYKVRYVRNITDAGHLENDADEIKNLLRMQLPSSLFMPMDRRDVLDVLQLQDKIANKAKDIAGLVLGRKMSLPESICNTYIEFLNRCVDATRQTQNAINELDELVAAGFRGNEVTRVKEMIKELHVIEDETDKIQIKLRAELYKIEKDLPPVDVMFIYKIIEWTGDLADNAQSTGNRLQLMLAK